MGTCIFTTIPISIHLMYVSPDTYNEHVSKQYSYSLIVILLIQAIANIYCIKIQAIYYSMLGGTIYMISSCSHDVIISTF